MEFDRERRPVRTPLHRFVRQTGRGIAPRNRIRRDRNVVRFQQAEVLADELGAFVAVGGQSCGIGIDDRLVGPVDEDDDVVGDVGEEAIALQLASALLLSRDEPVQRGVDEADLIAPLRAGAERFAATAALALAFELQDGVRALSGKGELQQTHHGLPAAAITNSSSDDFQRRLSADNAPNWSSCAVLSKALTAFRSCRVARA